MKNLLRKVFFSVILVMPKTGLMIEGREILRRILGPEALDMKTVTRMLKMNNNHTASLSKTMKRSGVWKCATKPPITAFIDPGSIPGQGIRPWLSLVEKGSMYTAELMTFPASAPQLVIKGCGMCYYVYVVVHIKDPQSLFVRAGHCVPVTGFYLVLNSINVHKLDLNTVKQTNKHTLWKIRISNLHN